MTQTFETTKTIKAIKKRLKELDNSDLEIDKKLIQSNKRKERAEIREECFKNIRCNKTERKLLNVTLDCLEKLKFIKARRNGATLQLKHKDGIWYNKKHYISLLKNKIENIRIKED